MSQWYYAHKGQQHGPVPEFELQRLASTGEFDPEKDLVWRDGMDDWKVASRVPELSFSTGAVTDEPPPLRPTAAVDESPSPAHGPNPYAAPATEATPHAGSGLESLEEIEPGSEPLRVMACISRGFELTKRHFGAIVAIGATYLLLALGIGMISGIFEQMLGGNPYSLEKLIQQGEDGGLDFRAADAPAGTVAGIVLINLVSNLATLFLGLGVVRIGLNIVSGQPFRIGMMFSQGDKLLRTFVASLLFGIAVGFGFLLLIVPGIYLFLRLGQYQTAIVDRNMGISQAFAYSSRLTQGQKMNLLGLMLMCLLIVLAGIMALLVGLIFAYPIVWLAGLVAYRWMQYGSAITRIEA